MRLVYTEEDEGELSFLNMHASCFRVEDYGWEVKMEDKGYGKLGTELFGMLILKRLKREVTRRVYFIADMDSPLDGILKKSRRFNIFQTEYMFCLEPDENRRPEENAELLFDEEEEDGEKMILVRSAEEGIFKAKLRPYGDGLYIYGVEVRYDMRFKGYGSRYMRSIDYAFKDKKLYLQVGSYNEAACNLYRHAGYREESGIDYFALYKKKKNENDIG